jgi:L-arabinose transport system substrate-binding protein
MGSCASLDSPAGPDRPLIVSLRRLDSRPLRALRAGFLAASLCLAAWKAYPAPSEGEPEASTKVKIGFLVKQPEEPWFQNEWKFADEAGRDFGFEVIKIGATDGEKVLSAIDNLAAQGAQGFVICTPDVKLGPSIVAKARAAGLKVMSVDDRLVDAEGNPIEEVPYMGISAARIGEMVGSELARQVVARGWSFEDTAALAISYGELRTARDRVAGAKAALLASGFPPDRIYDQPQKFPLDVESGFDSAQAAITKHPSVKHWLIFALNDETVMGGVRATESRGFRASDVCAIGIGGTQTADVEFKKAEETGFYATVCINARLHGYQTAAWMYAWITQGAAPPGVTYTAGRMMTRDNEAAVLRDMRLAE